MTSWFDQIEQGRLETELLDIRLKSDQHGEFRGQGFLSWDRIKGIEICALTDGGDSLAHKFRSGAPQLQIGRLIPPEWHLRLKAAVRSGDSVEIDRLCFDGCDVRSPHECVAWRLDNSHVRSAVDFWRGSRLEKAESVAILFANGSGLNWPRRSPSNEGCLQTTTSMGDVIAYAMPNDNVLVQITSSDAQDVRQVVNTVSMAFCFWSGKLLDVIGYEVRQDEALRCRLFPAHRRNSTRSVAPPLGHMLSLSLEAEHEALLRQAIAFFGNDEHQAIGNLIQTRASCPDVPFSVDILISCSILEWIAKRIAKTAHRKSEAISAEQKTDLVKHLQVNLFPTELIERFQGFMGRLNDVSGANALSEWCRTGFLGFSGDDWDAWKFRNKSAHGNLSLYGGDFEDREEAVTKRDRIHNMINKLVMHAIGFEGKYYDYATHHEQNFPSVSETGVDSKDGGDEA